MRSRLLIALVLLCGALVAAGSALATRSNSVRIAVSPSSGTYDAKYTVEVTGKTTTRGAALALAMTSTRDIACPTSYINGFRSLYGLSSIKGKTMAPKHVHGRLEQTIHAEMKVDTAGAYRICAYINVGETTLARASAPYTVRR